MPPFEILELARLAAMTIFSVAALGFGAYWLTLRRRAAVVGPDEIRALREEVQRIQQIVDTTAVELERTAELNRYLAGLLTQGGVPAAPPLASRAVTPH